MGQEIEHLFDFIHVGFLVDGGVGGNLVAKKFCHLDRLDALGEHSLAFDDQVMNAFEGIDMDVPVHPLAGSDTRPAVVPALADLGGFFLGDEFLGEKLVEERFGAGWRVAAGEVFAHFLPHEHAVGTNVNDPSLVKQSVNKFLEFRVDQGFTAAD